MKLLKRRPIEPEPAFRDVLDKIRHASNQAVLMAVQQQSPTADKARANKLTFEDKLRSLTGVSRWIPQEWDGSDGEPGEWVYPSEEEYPTMMGHREDAPLSVILTKLDALHEALPSRGGSDE